MIPINNSDTAWLIVADFNQDKDIGYPEELRGDILNPSINQWHWEDYAGFLYNAVWERVGNSTVVSEIVGSTSSISSVVGGNVFELVGGIKYGKFVGGHQTNWMK